jgi:hypothetical protein
MLGGESTAGIQHHLAAGQLAGINRLPGQTRTGCSCASRPKMLLPCTPVVTLLRAVTGRLRQSAPADV